MGAFESLRWRFGVWKRDIGDAAPAPEGDSKREGRVGVWKTGLEGVVVVEVDVC